MKSALVSGSMIAALCFGVAPAASSDEPPVSRRIEVRIETVATREGRAAETCEVVQTMRAGSTTALASWSALDVAGRDRRSVISRCGAGAFPGVTEPVLIQEISAEAGWDAGTMDPGAVGALRLGLTLTSRQRTGSSPDGKPIYGDPTKSIRYTRLEPGEEFFVPLPMDPGGREALGVHEVVLRVRAGWADREGATAYGAVAVVDAAPGSEVVLDGGVAGRVAPGGTLVLANVPVGLREISVRDLSRTAVRRLVTIVKGRTVRVSAGAATERLPSQAAMTPTGKNAEGFPEYRRARDGAIMVQIPEGTFAMGNLQTEGAPLPHDVYVSSFLMDKLPLTVGPFKRFAAATGRPLPPDPYWGVHDDSPVAFIRWDEAKAYCEWVGGRLPTEAEREKAARGTDGRLWPWGSEPPPAPERGVFRRDWGAAGNDAVGIRPAGASPYGLLDTGGNMWEYCEDWWDSEYFKSSPPRDPKGPKTGRARVVKGGSWDSRPTVLSASSRNFAYIGYREGDFGFRCASDLPR